jgi:hypothetical protein
MSDESHRRLSLATRLSVESAVIGLGVPVALEG